MIVGGHVCLRHHDSYQLTLEAAAAAARVLNEILLTAYYAHPVFLTDIISQRQQMSPGADCSVTAAEAVNDYADEDAWSRGSNALQLTLVMMTTIIIICTTVKTLEKTLLMMRMHDALNAYICVKW